MFISAVDQTIVDVALPDISKDLHAGVSELQWVMDGFLIALAGFLLVGSGLADRFGRKRVFLAGFAGFAVASLLAAASTTTLELIGARVLMGLAASCVLPPALSLMAVMFGPEERPKAVGIWSTVAGVGLALGPVLGGALVSAVGWSAVFLVNVPVAIAAIPAGILLLPESRRPGVPPLDLLGVGISVIALTGIAFAIIGGGDDGLAPRVVVAGAAGIAAALAFVVVELRREHPLFDVRVLARGRVFSGAAAIFAMYVAFFGVLFVLPQYIQYVQDRSTLVSGLLLLPGGVGLGIVSPFSGRLLARFGPHRLLPMGLTGMAVGCVLLVDLHHDSPLWLVSAAMGLIGLFLGTIIAPATAVIMNDLDLAQAGEAAATNQLARQVGGAMGVAVVGSVLSAVYASQLDDSLGGLPATAAETARDSIEGVVRVAAGLAPAAREQLLSAAASSFDTGARIAFGVCAATLLAAALICLVGLAERSPAPSPAPTGQ
jgi:MFS transporter, DHA2 family, multidrug resistance protein